MSQSKADLLQSTFAKTSTGQQEVQTREKKLSPLLRRLLILVDGKRTGRELASYFVGQDIETLLTDLLGQGCVTTVVKSPSAAVSSVAPSPNKVSARHLTLDELPLGLPAADTRGAKEVEMARNYMINTVNAEFGQHMCLSLIESISSCDSASQLRELYPSWYKTMTTGRDSAKELTVLVERLLRVI